MKIAHIVGNRPQFIKLALLQDELQRRAAGTSLIIHTGQHFDADMSEIFFGELSIPRPDYRLDVRKTSHNEMIGNILSAVDPILAQERPDCVIVYGDTNTTLAGALAAKKRNILLAHIESGVRTGKEDMPEESNRYLTDRMADWNFACTSLGKENLTREGFGEGGPIHSEVHVCGDLMLDAAFRFAERARQSGVLGGLPGIGKPGEQGEDRGSAFILATIHRAENTEEPGALREILTALNTLHDRIPVVFPMHPRTRQALDGTGIVPRFVISPPLGYLDMLSLVQSCRSVITDSGGLAREAFFFSKPALVVMQNPFWPELFSHGRCLQAGALSSDILRRQEQLDQLSGPWMRDIFGDGHAAAKISEILAGGLAAKEGSGHE
jgi:UDP-GlcNAc3NAcA epimerase